MNKEKATIINKTDIKFKYLRIEAAPATDPLGEEDNCVYAYAYVYAYAIWLIILIIIMII